MNPTWTMALLCRAMHKNNIWRGSLHSIHITNAPYDAHADPLFKACSILKIPDLMNQQTMKLMLRVLCSTAPQYLHSLFPKKTYKQPHCEQGS